MDYQKLARSLGEVKDFTQGQLTLKTTTVEVTHDRVTTAFTEDDVSGQVFVNDKLAYTLRRRNPGGQWDLLLSTKIGLVVIDSDRYRHDLVERAATALRKKRFKIICSPDRYRQMYPNWLESMNNEFGPRWTSEYSDYEGHALFTQGNTGT